MVSGRRLVLHIGMGKTGSSALQVAFVRNRELLSRLGVHYPAHETDAQALAGDVVSGNGMGITAYLAPRADDARASKAAWRRLRQEIRKSRQQTVLYSSEFLYQFRPDRLQELREAMADQGVTVQAVAYVRDVAGHALSSYSQILKRSPYTGTFSDYLAGSGRLSYNLNLQPRLSRLAASLGRENVTVLHYDSERRRLVESFLTDVLGVSDLAAFDLSAGTVNRSLTRHEIEIMRYVNGQLRRRKQVARVSAALLDLPPLGSADSIVTAAELDEMRLRWAEDVQWVNAAFFGDSRFRVDGGARVVADAAAAGLELSDLEKHMLDTMTAVITRRAERVRASRPAS